MSESGSSAHSLHSVFSPTSVAVVGASADPAKRGFQILRALGESGYRGRVFPVNPRGGSLMGHQVFPSVRSLPEPVDLAVLCTPAATVPDLLTECGERAVGAALVLAVGFGESGAEGVELQRAVAGAAEEHGVRVIGPNTSGMLNMHAGLNLIGARGVRPGGIALLVQSGNMALSLMNEVTARTWEGISICLGVGNEIDLGFPESLEYLGEHEDTRAVIVYAEGIRAPRRFLEVAANVARTKPVVVLKAARSAAGATSALSHTGSVAGPYDRFAAGLAQAGATSLLRTDELLHVAETLANQPAPAPGSAIAILSDGGGQGTLAVDGIAELGAPLAALAESTRTRLRDLLGRAAAVGNPVDLAGAADADPRTFGRALEVLAEDPAVGTVLVVGLFGGYGIRFADSLARPEIEAARDMVDVMRRLGKGLVVHSMYASHRSDPLDVLGKSGVPVVESLDVAVRCVVELERRSAALERPEWPPRRPVAGSASAPTVAAALADGRILLSEPEARELLGHYGVEFGPARLASSEDDVGAALSGLGAPVALKVVSHHIVHKSDAGGVVLGVDNEQAARDAFRTIADRATEYSADHGLPSHQPAVLVVPMEGSPQAELLVGAIRDDGLGPVLSLGAGGIWVELLGDVVHRLLPCEEADLAEALSQLRISPLLDGARGTEPLDRGGVVRLAKAVARCIEEEPAVAEIEINPLFVYEDRVVPVDARVVLRNR